VEECLLDGSVTPAIVHIVNGIQWHDSK
jgi:hypothetical protein